MSNNNHIGLKSSFSYVKISAALTRAKTRSILRIIADDLKRKQQGGDHERSNDCVSRVRERKKGVRVG